MTTGDLNIDLSKKRIEVVSKLFLTGFRTHFSVLCYIANSQKILQILQKNDSIVGALRYPNFFTVGKSYTTYSCRVYNSLALVIGTGGRYPFLCQIAPRYILIATEHMLSRELAVRVVETAPLFSVRRVVMKCVK